MKIRKQSVEISERSRFAASFAASGLRGFGVVAVLIFSLGALSFAQNDNATKVYRQGDSWIEETTGTMPASRIIKVHTSVGSVSVTGGQQPNITYVIRKKVHEYSEQSARRAFDKLRIVASRQGDAAYFGGEGSENWNRGTIEFLITTPRNVDLVKAETNGGSLQFAHLTGRVDAKSGGGGATFDDITGSVNGQTGGGSVTVGNVAADVGVRTGGGSVDVNSVGGKLNVSTGGGSVHVQNGKSSAKIETGGGSIHVENIAGDLVASTGGGSIEVGTVGGLLDVETGGGSIRLAGANGPIRAQTGSGSIHCLKVSKSVRAETGAGGITAEFMAMNGQFSDSTLDTGVGDIIVYLPSDLKVSIHASIDVATSRDAISSDLPGIHISSEGGDYGPREMSAEGDLNGGGPMLKLHTSTGRIQFIALKR